MSHQNETFGIMDEGYFVPRGEILSWVNALLHLNLTKIEQLGSGAVYCQILDVIHPGKVSLSKVNWKARHDYEFVDNLRILQTAFNKVKIQKHVEVEKLAKAKYQDNLEFIQWLKRYFDVNCGQRGQNYNPEQRRGGANIDLGFAQKTIIPKTYNGNGVVQSANNEEGTKRIKSPTAKKIERTKSPTQTPNKVSSFKNLSEVQSKKKIECEGSMGKKKSDISLDVANQLEELRGKVEYYKKETDEYMQKSKKSDMKVDMIKDILKKESDDSMKITLIEEILKE